ncbi:four helix bundle protein [Persicimonas caeni]|uniref:Four helix bundle protein n=1 Tax=Persicimonas caeni TaxID=2292766 RepID=A0A4Y6PUW5_PERCE|nr:four helix bundle protein [Persicimonas caeni]QDG52040.1 four helix bundle protein [Persicimonas caeni]QED33261.1 four helix bundle protein [Persicimonas caeni]
MLSHEKFDVYDVALDFVAITSVILERLPRGTGNLKSQLNRASTSILLNIAEGAGKVRPKDKASFYTIARGSTFECGAIYDVLNARHLIKPTEHERGKSQLVRIASMLTKLINLE